jgi:hypothetical protein
MMEIYTKIIILLLEEKSHNGDEFIQSRDESIYNA